MQRFQDKIFLDQFFKFISQNILASMELKLRFFPRQRKSEPLGLWYAEGRSATWRNYISMIQTTIPQFLNCYWKDLLQKKVNFVLQRWSSPASRKFIRGSSTFRRIQCTNIQKKRTYWRKEVEWHSCLQTLQRKYFEAEVSKLVMRYWYVVVIKTKEKQMALFIGVLWVQNCGRHFRRPEGKNSRSQIGFNTFNKEATTRGSRIARIPQMSYCTFVLFTDTLVGDLISLELMGHVAIPHKWKEFLFHRGCSTMCNQSLGQDSSLEDENAKEDRPSSSHLSTHSEQSRRRRNQRWPLQAEKSYSVTRKIRQDAVYWINLARAQDKGLQFWQTRSHVIVVSSSVLADCIYKLISQKGERTIWKTLDVSSRTEDSAQECLVMTAAAVTAAARYIGECCFGHQQTGTKRGRTTSTDNSASGNVRDQRQEGQSSSLAPKAQAQTHGMIPSNSSGRSGESPSGTGGRILGRNFFWRKCTNPSCNYLHPPVCVNCKFESGCTYGETCRFRNVEADGQPSEKSKKRGVEKDQLHCWRSLYHWVVRLKILIRENRFLERRKNWIRSHRQSLQGHVAPQIIVKEGSIARRHSKVRTSQVQSVRSQVWGKDTRRKERWESREAWDLTESVYNLKNADKATCHPPAEATIRNPLRSVHAHVEQKGSKLRWTGNSSKVQESHNGDNTARKHKYTFTILISSWRCKNSMTRLQFYHLESSAKNTDIPMSGPAVKSRTWPNMGRIFHAKRKMSYLLLSLDCRQILVPVRLLHGHRRTRQDHLQVQQQSEVTIWHQETGAIHQKNPKQK